MWPEASYVNTVHLVKNITPVAPEISNYSNRITFLARPVGLRTEDTDDLQCQLNKLLLLSVSSRISHSHSALSTVAASFLTYSMQRGAWRAMKGLNRPC